MKTPAELRYMESHEWVSKEGDDTATIGITDFAQDQLGDVVFVELPAPGTVVAAGDQVAVVESVKTASDIYSPVSGTITDVNSSLELTPESINTSPYEEGWLFRVRMSDENELDALLSASEYIKVATEGA